MSLFLGIDMGTSACRIAAIDSHDQVLALVREPLPDPMQHGPECEQDATLWWAATEVALEKVLSLVEPDHIDAIAVDGTSSTLLLCDSQGKPAAPALMYRDQRAVKQTTELASFAPPTAAVHSPSSSLAKLLWYKDNGRLEPGLIALHQADWISGHLTSQFNTSDENNALKLGYDAVSRSWPDWLKGCDLPEGCLPYIQPAGTPVTPVSIDIARRFGLREDCLVATGTTDSTATFIASGACEPGDAVTVLGSTLVVKILSGTPIFAPEYGIYSHRLGDQWLVGGASNAGGTVLRQFFSDEQLASLSTAIDPTQASGLNYYPLPSRGERFPDNNPELESRLSPRPENDVEFLHGLLESLARIEQRGYERLVELGAPPPRTVRTSGGGAQNTTWTAIRQRHLSVPFQAVQHTEAAIGAALLARKASQ